MIYNFKTSKFNFFLIFSNFCIFGIKICVEIFFNEYHNEERNILLRITIYGFNFDVNSTSFPILRLFFQTDWLSGQILQCGTIFCYTWGRGEPAVAQAVKRQRVRGGLSARSSSITISRREPMRGEQQLHLMARVFALARVSASVRACALTQTQIVTIIFWNDTNMESGPNKINQKLRGNKESSYWIFGKNRIFSQ